MGASIRTSCLLLLVFGAILHCSASKDGMKHQLPSAMVVGTVYCDTCFHHQFSRSSHLISGAIVSVECGAPSTKSSFKKEVKTNRHGTFRVRLPLRVGRHVERIESCSVKLIKSNEPFCAVASSATSSVLHLKSRSKRVHVFSAGFFTFKPLNQPEVCYQKPGIADSKQDQPPVFFLPSPQIPFVPSPPTFGGFPMPPNPFQPPSLLPPNPFQPPPSVLPPLPFQPSPPPIVNNPQIPFITPSPPPPAFRLPPLPFPPNPLFPGIPPALPSKKNSP